MYLRHYKLQGEFKMSDEIKKDKAPEKESTGKPKAVKKTAAAKKEKVSAKPASDQAEADNKIINKLKAMGVMSGGKKNDAVITSDKSIFPFIAIMSVMVVAIVGYLIWTLNKNIEGDYTASSMNNVQPVAQWMPQYNNQNNGPSNYNRELQHRMQTQQEQYNKWVQQQQQAQEQRRAQQQKWAQQWQQAQEQQRAQQQKWAQQPPTQEQYRTQQKKWAQQQQQAREQQRVQQQNWAQQWQKAQEQQRAQQQQRARSQQPYFANPQSGYQGQPYNYASRYQQPGSYYGPQY